MTQASDTFAETLSAVTANAEQTIKDDANRYFEEAHGAQDEAMITALDWIAGHSTDEQARELARQALRAVESGGTRWYA